MLNNAHPRGTTFAIYHSRIKETLGPVKSSKKRHYKLSLLCFTIIVENHTEGGREGGRERGELLLSVGIPRAVKFKRGGPMPPPPLK